MKYSAILIAALLAACGEQVVNTFEAPASLYFYRGSNNSAGSPQLDSTNYSFFLAVGPVTEDTLWLDVRLTGNPLPRPRSMTLAQLNAGEEGAAVAGIHHAPLDDPRVAPHMTLPAGATSFAVPVIVKRVPEMDTASFRLQIAIEPGNDFVAGVKNRETYVVHITAMAVKPAAWDRYYDSAFGAWGQAKMRFLIDHVGYTTFEESLSNTDLNTFYNRKAREKLAEYEAANGGPLYEADGVTQVIIP
ncbi:MAG: DUF4843 domain-containing protein [Odoribacteraceae bacterium]|jgi:hypothetical protein|nr:DUF4843 domain-containing protein [Odoribacteraceae bacterium]